MERDGINPKSRNRVHTRVTARIADSTFTGGYLVYNYYFYQYVTTKRFA